MGSHRYLDTCLVLEVKSSNITLRLDADQHDSLKPVLLDALANSVAAENFRTPNGICRVLMQRREAQVWHGLQEGVYFI